MKNAELKKGLDLIIEGLSVISNSLVEEEIMNPPVHSGKSDDKSEKSESDSAKVEDLDSLKIAELKKKAKELGVETVGTRKELIANIKNALSDEEAEEETEEVEEASGDEFDAQAKEIAEEEEADDIIEALKDVGIKATKKNYIEKLAEALRNGLLSLEDDEEDESEDSEEEDSNAGEVKLGEYNPTFDSEGFNDPKSMSKKRKSACDSLVKETLKKIEDGKISRDDIIAYLDEILTDDEKDLLDEDNSDDNIISMYLEVLKRTVDADGEVTDLGEPYELEDETPMCCAHKLKYDKKSKMYICEICGQEYEADED